MSKPLNKKSTLPNDSEYKESQPEEDRRPVDSEGFLASMVQLRLQVSFPYAIFEMKIMVPFSPIDFLEQQQRETFKICGQRRGG